MEETKMKFLSYIITALIVVFIILALVAGIVHFTGVIMQ